MNIKVQCCGIVLILLLVILYGRRRKLDLIATKVFLACLFATMLCIGVDILSIVAIVYQDSLPALVPELVCKAYLATLIMVAFLALAYVAAGVSFHLSNYRRNVSVYALFSLVVIVVIFILPIEIYRDIPKDLSWTDGPSVYMTYFGLLVLFVINLVQIIGNKKFIFQRKRRTVLIWMLLWLGAACVQGALHNHILIAGFAGSLGIMVVFIQFENPELHLDRNSGLFSGLAFSRYGEQLYSDRNRKPFYVIAVLLEIEAWQEVHGDREKHLFDAFLKIPGAAAFRVLEDEIILVFKEEKKAHKAWDALRRSSREEVSGAIQGQRTFYYLDDPRCVASGTELLQLIRHVSVNKKDTKLGGFYVIGGDEVTEMRSETQMTQEIVEALEEDRVVVYYQPIFSVEKQCFTSAEALVRIIGRDGKLVPPGAFIDIAEKNGLIIDLGKRVFEKVCAFFQESRLVEYGIEYIEVNLSVVQCADERLAEDYLAVIDRTGLEPRRINLEITESASLRAKQVLISNMERLIASGIHFSLDDFGTGGSNLNYIVDMPVKIVKFDREMIQAYFASGKAKYVMDAAMHMIQGMDLEIVAEGIETEEQYKKMEEIKIDFIQGYYFSRPLPEGEFLEFLRQKKTEL